MPEDWTPDDGLRKWTRETIAEADVDPRRELEQFRDYWLAKAGRDATKLDWPRTWQRWIRDSVQRASRRPGAPVRLSEAAPSVAAQDPSYRPMREVLAEAERRYAGGA